MIKYMCEIGFNVVGVVDYNIDDMIVGVVDNLELILCNDKVLLRFDSKENGIEYVELNVSGVK